MFLKSSLRIVKNMRTKRQLEDGDAEMTTLRHIKEIAARAEATLLQDALGAAALMVMLVVGLHLPSLI
jgi:hypothetical protein